MGTVALNVQTELHTLQCGTCGVWHAIPEHMYSECARLGGFWHCPNGHCRGWESGSDATKIKRLEKELQAERDRKQAALDRANIATQLQAKAESALKRHKTRTKNGTCPCCNRTFQQLARHMASKHPGFKP